MHRDITSIVDIVEFDRMNTIDFPHNHIPGTAPTINVDFPESSTVRKIALLKNHMRHTAHLETGIKTVYIVLVVIFDQHQTFVLMFHLTPP
ncbi:hypothetical protein D5272_01750 [bacterium D16-76]|nr:hypothetical protein [bacterium D16-76]